MINTAAELYSKLLTDYNLPENILCDLHNPCNKIGGHRCQTKLEHKLINFDRVKTERQRGVIGLQKASTDGYTYKDNLFCFVELKGWEDFLRFHTNQVTLESEIEEQVNKYNLDKKLTDSMLICKEVAQNDSIFKDANIAFILVTDIDTEENGTMEIYSDLMNLAESSTKWELVCNRELKDKLLTLPSNINTYYTKCQNFDDIIKQI